MKTAIQSNSRLWAIGEAPSVSTVTKRILRDLMSDSTSTSAGTSNTSCRHSREVSSSIGKLGYFAATSSKPADR